MSSKNISRNSAAGTLSGIVITLILVFVLSFSVFAQEEALLLHQQPQIRVIYPKPLQVVTATDSTFILGHLENVSDDWSATLTINGLPVKIHEGHTFLAFVPIAPDSFTFHLECELATNGKNPQLTPLTFSNDITVYIPPPVKSISLDTLMIKGDYKPPIGDLVMATGDELNVAFVGTPAHRGWFSIPGVVDSVPMSEISPQNQTYWGEAVFGAGAVPDSFLIRGIYTGVFKVTPNVRIDTARIIYHLNPPSPFEILTRMYISSFDTVSTKLTKYLRMKKLPSAICTSGYKITLNSPEYPFTVRFKDSVLTVRQGPVKGYQSIFQPKDIEALVVGAQKPWYKIRLSKNQYGWVYDTSVVKMGEGIRPPVSYLKTIRTKSNGRKLTLEFPLAGKHPFKVTEFDRQSLQLQLFGVITDTDWIRYDMNDPSIDIITWSQPEDGVYQVDIKLNEKIWGYDTYYRGNTFFLDIIKPPDDIRRMRDKIIVIDPGHSGDPGSIGPSGYTEAEANLAIALELKQKLESRGAKVIMTRMDQSNVPLYDRPVIAKLNNADIFVSVHNNALPDGVNPYKNNGSSTYYYHPHSIDLGRAIHRELLKATKLPDHGFYHGNLAVNRPTQYPAVLVECAFMIIPEQEQMLKTESFHRKVAEAISDGIENFLKDFDNVK